jgi:hypothetical protein
MCRASGSNISTALAEAVHAHCMQVSCNVLLLECMAAAGHWGPARRHVESLQRCLPLKATGPAAAAAEQLAGWRATCLVRASLTATPRVGEDMNRLLAELSTPRAKVRAAVCMQGWRVVRNVDMTCKPLNWSTSTCAFQVARST